MQLIKGERERGSVPLGVIGAAIAVLVVGSLIWMVSTFQSQSKDSLGLVYHGGPAGHNYMKTLEPGQGLSHVGFFSDVYSYPVTQRNYVVSLNPDEGDRSQADAIPATTSDRQTVQWEGALQFKLNLSKVQQFHEQIGLKYQAWTADGWKRLLNDTVRQQLENSLVQATRGFTVSDIYSNPQTLQQVQDAVNADLTERIKAVFGDDYFCGPTYNQAQPNVCPDIQFTIKNVVIPDQIKQAYQDVQSANIEVQKAAMQVRANQQVAKSIKELQNVLNGASGYNYVLYQAVQSGKVQFWVLPQGGNVTVPAPAPAH